MTHDISTHRPSVLFEKECYDKWMWLIQHAPGEISVLADVTLGERSIFTINEIFLLDQMNGGASTEISPEALAVFLTQKQRDGYDISRLRGHLHSHVNMGCFWSGTDEANIVRYAGSSPWLFSAVFNKKGEMKTRLDIFTPVHVHLNDVPLAVKKITVEDARVAAWEEEYKERTKSVHWAAPETSVEHPRWGNERFSEDLFGHKGSNGKPVTYKRYEEVTELLETVRLSMRLTQKQFEEGNIDHNAYVTEYDKLSSEAKALSAELEHFWEGQSGIFA